jgi:hypothetical protein
MSASPILRRPNWLDVIALSLFTVLITFHPHYLRGEINFFELGLYLPGIDALFRGEVPFRDFFHLRGPFELYMPALSMLIWGKEIAVMATYFYVGSVLTLLIWILVAQQLYRTRLLLYLMVPVFVGRTFPRVVFTYWGGMRYAVGAMAVLCAVQYFRKQTFGWIFAAGLFSAFGFFTSIEIGVCAIAGVLAALAFAFVFQIQDKKVIGKSFLAYAAGLACIVVPYAVYLLATNSFWPYIESVYTVVTRMETTFNLNFISTIPNNPAEALAAMLNPSSKNFRHMTPSYVYIALFAFLLWKIKKKEFTPQDLALVCLGGYGLVMYNAAFRAIWASQFEMALQPEKILWFYLLERWFFFLREKGKEKAKFFAARFLILVLIASSVGYAIQRYNSRFFVFKYVRNVLTGKETDSLKPLADIPMVRMEGVDRVRGMVAPQWQARNLTQLTGFFNEHTAPGEQVFMFPELGMYQFVINRPFVGRFPMVTFSWFQDHWHEEMAEDLKAAAPRFVVISKDPGPTFPQVYFRIEKNKQKYDEVMALIARDYVRIGETETLWIYRRRGEEN